MSKNKEIVKVNKEAGLVSYQITTIDSYFGLNGSGESDGASKGERALTHSFLMDTLRKLMGRTLTVIDASISDKNQNKAIKDLVRNMYSDEMDFSAIWAFDQGVITNVANDSFAKLSPKEQEKVLNSSVSIEEALGVE